MKKQRILDVPKRHDESLGPSDGVIVLYLSVTVERPTAVDLSLVIYLFSLLSFFGTALQTSVRLQLMVLASRPYSELPGFSAPRDSSD